MKIRAETAEERVTKFEVCPLCGDTNIREFHYTAFITLHCFQCHHEENFTNGSNITIIISR